MELRKRHRPPTHWFASVLVGNVLSLLLAAAAFSGGERLEPLAACLTAISVLVAVAWVVRRFDQRLEERGDSTGRSFLAGVVSARAIGQALLVPDLLIGLLALVVCDGLGLYHQRHLRAGSLQGAVESALVASVTAAGLHALLWTVVVGLVDEVSRWLVRGWRQLAASPPKRSRR